MPASALEGLDSATLRLDTAQLVWQSEFVLTCVVTSMDTGDVGTGSLRLRPVGGGVRARLPAERRSVSAGQPVFLDGSRSADLDRRPGSLAFTWSCQLADGGGGCFVGKPGALRRLEQHLGQEAVSQPTLRVPADLLGADTWYRFTLRVEKNSDVDEASTEVFVGRQRRPRLWINRNQDFFSPYEPIYIPAQVSTDWRVTVRRLCGEVIRFTLRVDAEGEEADTYSAEVEIRMPSGPLQGELAVSGRLGSHNCQQEWLSLLDARTVYVEVCSAAGICRSVESDAPQSSGEASDENAERSLGELFVEATERHRASQVLGWALAARALEEAVTTTELMTRLDQALTQFDLSGDIASLNSLLLEAVVPSATPPET
ncbi:uncharacterized protein LOC119098238 [Pollicipes pollicipes]|uniref:uncharacterized protein LOC119098238 n=1 Tax=Pollicipes pollicipes TaxID=41117 RepID=UPI001884E0F3|nr:uncharacterized protein LOC119098238 [Pollicipes pollicipes]